MDIWLNYGTLNKKSELIRQALKTAREKRIVERLRSHGWEGLK